MKVKFVKVVKLFKQLAIFGQHLATFDQLWQLLANILSNTLAFFTTFDFWAVQKCVVYGIIYCKRSIQYLVCTCRIGFDTAENEPSKVWPACPPEDTEIPAPEYKQHGGP